MSNDAGTVYPLEPTSEQMRAMGHAALDFLVRFIEELPDAPAADVEGADIVVAKLRESAPEMGAGFDDVLNLIGEAAAKAFNPAGPGYLAFIPGGGLFAAALADMLADGTNRFVNIAAPAPAFAQIEWTVVRWLCDLFDYPEDSGGVLTSGGSMANLSAIVTARHDRLGEDFLDGTMYVSAQAHASLAKAAMIVGIPVRNVREIPTTPDLKMDTAALVEAIEADRISGLRPFCIVANAGTTNTGTIDALEDLAEIASAEGIWLHADAAYGGPFRLTERGKARLRGIERCDSITLDPHKAMFLPYGTGSLLVRDRNLLRDAHTVEAAYLQDLDVGLDIPNFADHSPELSRDFRGLRVWLPIKLHGLGAFRRALDEKLDLADFLYEGLTSTPGFEVPWQPELTVVAFRYEPERGDPEEFNRRLLTRINASKRIFLSSTMIEGRFTLRACIVSHRTHRERIEEALEIIRGSAEELAASF